MLHNIQKIASSISVQYGYLLFNNKLLHPLWLRNRCLSPKQVQVSTKQRLFELTDLKCIVTNVDIIDNKLKIKFSDGHISDFTINYLLDESNLTINNLNNLPTSVMWNAKDNLSKFEWQATDIVNIGPENTLKSKEIEIMKFAKHMCIFGFAIIRGLPSQKGIVKQFSNLIGIIRDTNWGNVFDVENKVIDNNVGVSQQDIAYTNLELPLHVDNPYREPVPGYQLLHCIVQDVDKDNGESIVVDGLYIVDLFKNKYPKYFDILSKVPIKFEFSDKNVCLKRSAPHFEIDNYKNFKAINFSGRLDYVPNLNIVEMEHYFAARQKLVEILRDNSTFIKFKLNPGDLLFIDNRRCLHGRRSFNKSTNRFLQGCYIDKDMVHSLYYKSL